MLMATARLLSVSTPALGLPALLPRCSPTNREPPRPCTSPSALLHQPKLPRMSFPYPTVFSMRSCGHSMSARSGVLQSGRLTSTSSQLSCQGCSLMERMPMPRHVVRTAVSVAPLSSDTLGGAQGPGVGGAGGMRTEMKVC